MSPTARARDLSRSVGPPRPSRRPGDTGVALDGAGRAAAGTDGAAARRHEARQGAPDPGSGRRRRHRGAGDAGLGPVATVEAQTVPSGALEQLDRLIGNRVETPSILGTQSGASGGTYASDVNDSAVEVFKITGRGDLSSPHPIGDSGVGWDLVLEGGIGRVTTDNRFRTGALVGNESSIETISASLGRGSGSPSSSSSASRRPSGSSTRIPRTSPPPAPTPAGRFWPCSTARW